MASAAPIKAAKLLRMAQFLERIEYRWTIQQYLDTPAGYIQFMLDYWNMRDSSQEASTWSPPTK
jgi:hypothetical protein